jgi:succinate dehydrogenase assembly factor 2
MRPAGVLVRASLRHAALTTRYRVHLSQRLLSQTSLVRADPYVLPHTPEHIRAGQAPDVPDGEIDLNAEELPYPKPLERKGESLETMRARLVYQSRKRGTRETELLLSTFVQENLNDMSPGEMAQVDKVSDQRVLPLPSSATACPEASFSIPSYDLFSATSRPLPT